MSTASQFAWRSQRSVGVFSGPPEYSSLTDELDEGSLHRASTTFQYSPNGALLAFAFDSHCLVLSTRREGSSNGAAANDGDYTCRPLHTLDVEKVLDMRFSPRGGFLCTWQRPFKDANGENAKNLNVWDCSSGECVGSFERKLQSGCHFQFTQSEDACVRMVTNELHVFDPKSIDGKGVIGRLKLENISDYEIGPGAKPSIAVFCGEKQGAPASVRIYQLASLMSENSSAVLPISQKNFFKADKIQIKWNTQGTALLFATSTDHDKTGKSYYGETNLYMMSTRGDFDCRVALDKEGPVHDFEWNPNGKEFVVVYGYMPAKCTLFSYRINIIAELGTTSRNFVAFNPQGRLFALAGFGNLSGTVDIWDREKLGQKGASVEANAAGKVYSFDASNSSLFQWSPDGQFILTATLSPRLRVDNGVRVWHCTGQLVHIDMINELYQASWRPMLALDAFEQHKFPNQIPTAPQPSTAAQAMLDAKKAKAAARTGVYRPPGARSLPESEIRKIEEAANLPSSSSSPHSRSGASTPSGAYMPPGKKPGQRRVVPGAAPPSGGNAQQGGQGQGQGRRQQQQQQHQRGDQHQQHSANRGPPAASAAGPVNLAADVGGSSANGNGNAPTAAGSERNGKKTSQPNASEDALDASQDTTSGATDKKIRNITKKLKAISDLKQRQSRGEKLEQTQLQKIQSEAVLKKELQQYE